LIVVIFVLLAAVLVRAAGRIDGNSRVVPWVRRLRCPGSGGGSDLPRRIEPCLHPASTTRRPATGR
jgi:hypothetical protein